ncbi:hypothetical protein D3C81_1915150 [compost metagenome]
MTDHALDAVFAARQHSFATQLRAGSGGGRQGYQARKIQVWKVRQGGVVGNDLRPFETVQTLNIDGGKTNALGRVHGTAAAQSDQRVVLASLERVNA